MKLMDRLEGGTNISRYRLNPHVSLFLIVILHSFFLWSNWKGVGWSDSLQYANAALDLLEGEMPVTHWGLRWPLILPMAASAKLFGETEISLGLPMFGYSSLAVILIYYICLHFIGYLTACATGIIAATSPFIANPLVSIHIPELSFSLAAIYSAALAHKYPSHLTPLFSAGAFCWFACACRETSAYLPFSICLAYIALRSSSFRAMASGLKILASFLFMIFLEILFYKIIYGDWLYRVHVDLNHGSGRPGTEALQSDVLDLWAWARPAMDTVFPSLMSPVFLVCAGGILLVLYQCSRGIFDKKIVFTYFISCSVFSYVLCVGALNLERYYYYPIACITAMIFAGFFLAPLLDMSSRHFRLTGLVGLVLVCASSNAILAVSQVRDNSEVREMVQYVIAQDASVKSADFVESGRLFLRLGGRSPDLMHAIDSTSQVFPGDLVFARTDFGEDQNWTEIAEYEKEGMPFILNAVSSLLPNAFLGHIPNLDMYNRTYTLWRA